MYVCLCNAISDKQIRSFACEGRCSVAEVYRRCGCQPKCGKCIPMVKEILRENGALAMGEGAFLTGAAAKPSE